MRSLAIALMVLFATVYAENSAEKIYEKALQISLENHEDEDKLLFALYSEELPKLSLETLQANPELVFRKALIVIEVVEVDASEESNQEKFQSLQIDFEFVMRHTDPNSRLFAAAKLRRDYVSYLLGAASKDEASLVAAAALFWEECLRQWSPGSLATGQKLREEVLYNLQRSPEFLLSFRDFLLIAQNQIEIVLGYIQPDTVLILGIRPEEDGESYLFYRIEYRPSPLTRVTIEAAF